MLGGLLLSNHSPAVPSQRANHAARRSHQQIFFALRTVSNDVGRHVIAVIDPNASRTTAQNIYADLLKKYHVELPEDKEHFCCAIMNEIMMDPVIDPHTLNSKATAWLSASDSEN